MQSGKMPLPHGVKQFELDETVAKQFELDETVAKQFGVIVEKRLPAASVAHAKRQDAASPHVM